MSWTLVWTGPTSFCSETSKKFRDVEFYWLRITTQTSSCLWKLGILGSVPWCPRSLLQIYGVAGRQTHPAQSHPQHNFRNHSFHYQNGRYADIMCSAVWYFNNTMWQEFILLQLEFLEFGGSTIFCSRMPRIFQRGVRNKIPPWQSAIQQKLNWSFVVKVGALLSHQHLRVKRTSTENIPSYT